MSPMQNNPGSEACCTGSQIKKGYVTAIPASQIYVIEVSLVNECGVFYQPENFSKIYCVVK
jgi:hypothetical protein